MTSLRQRSDRAKGRLMDWCESEIRAEAAERIAAAIANSAPRACTDPFCSPGCAHYARFEQALRDAEIAREWAR